MPQYRHLQATGRDDEVTVIEDEQMVVTDGDGTAQPSFAFIDPYTIRAHPRIIDLLVRQSERLWTLDELLDSLR